MVRPCFQQRGVALITVLLVLVIATITAVAMTSRQQLDIRRTENILRHEQAYLFLLGAEDWAVQLLAKDIDDNKTDTLGDDWATVLPPMPIEGGQISGEIQDLQGRFNINSLVIDGKVNKENEERFTRLLVVLGITPAIVDSIIDWLDVDDTPRTQGAEDDVYLVKVPAYRAANRYMTSVSELLYVNGVSYEMYEQLQPYVTALPEPGTINVNTASAQIIASLAEGITLDLAQQLVETRGNSGYATVDEFLQISLFSGKKVNKTGLSVISNHFLLSATVIMGDRGARLQSIVRRVSSKDIMIINRSQG